MLERERTGTRCRVRHSLMVDLASCRASNPLCGNARAPEYSTQPFCVGLQDVGLG